MDMPVLRALSETSRKAEMFDWLMTQMTGHSLHMDGKRWWSLPCAALSKYPSKRPQEAVEAAYAQYQPGQPNPRKVPRNTLQEPRNDIKREA